MKAQSSAAFDDPVTQMSLSSSRSATKNLKGTFAKTALVLQGGGALGAYQAGVYEALTEAGCEPDWVAGISIGAINAAIIAGNAPGERVTRLRAFWQRVSSQLPWYDAESGDFARRAFNQWSAVRSMIGGQPGFFAPRMPPAWLRQHGAQGAVSVYDTSPLFRTLTTLVDFDRINARGMRLSLGAVNVRLGNVVYFDNMTRRIGPEHVMASGALPPGFPPITIDGECYWDGGLVSNTPLSYVLDSGPEQDTLVFQVDLFSARGPLPGDLIEAEARRKDITYSSRTRLNTDIFKHKHALRRAIVALYEALPPDAQKQDWARALRELGSDHAVAIVHLIYGSRPYEGQTMDFDFSRLSMEEHWQAGLDDARRTLRQPRWLEDWDAATALRVFDIARGGG